MKYSVNQLKKEWVITKGIALEDFLLLALKVTDKTRTEFSREPDHLLTPSQQQEFLRLLARREQSEPVAYLLGEKEFFGRTFFVNEHTLIPRPDSECLIEDLLAYYQEDPEKPGTLFDIGTGSGALAITLAKELENFPLYFAASDISCEALEKAKMNADFHNTSIHFVEGPFLKPFQSFFPLDTPLYIIANLPYVSPDIFRKTAPDVQHYEPTSALLSADAGLAHYKKLLQELCTQKLGTKTTVWLEISPEQSPVLSQEIKNLFPETTPFTGQDLSGRDRFLHFRI